jgi:hypothetical protein
VGKPLIFTEQEIRFLQELTRQRVRFLIVGLSAANLQGAPAVTQDVDLWFEDLADTGIGKALAKVGGAYAPPTALTRPMFAGKSVALFDIVLTMDGLRSFAQEYRSALRIRLGGATVRVLPLRRIIASKRAANRPKDKLVLPVLEDTLLAVRALRPKEESKAITKGVAGRKA